MSYIMHTCKNDCTYYQASANIERHNLFAIKHFDGGNCQKGYLKVKKLILWGSHITNL